MILSKHSRLLLTINKTPVSTWQGFKELCEAYDLPYHSLKSKPFPRKWREFEVLKLPFRSRGQEKFAYEEASIYTVLFDLVEGNGLDEVFMMLHNVATDLEQRKELEDKFDEAKKWEWS